MVDKVRFLSVCGSGVVTSHMVANKIVDLLSEQGYDADPDECNPSELEGYLMRSQYNFIAYSSPIGPHEDVPAFSAMGLITGMGDDEFVAEVVKCLKEQGK